MSTTDLSDNPPEFSRDDLRDRVTSHVTSLWWMSLLRGIALICLGLFAVFQPGLTLATLVQLVAAFAIIDGVIALVAAARGAATSRGSTALRGAIMLLIGLFVFMHPYFVGAFTATFLILLIALGAIVMGVLEIMAAVQDRDEIGGGGWLILGGVISILFGLIIACAPWFFGQTIIRIIGFFTIVAGISLAMFGLRLRGIGNHNA